jgi:gliding motility-associated-like protein
LVPGSHNIKLISETLHGCRDTLDKQVVVNPSPIAKFSINDSTQCFNEQKFIVSNESTINSGNLKFKWQIGQDSFSTTNLQLSNLIPGDTNLVLIAISDFNCPDTITKQLTVFHSPDASFTVNDSTQCLSSHSFDFTNTSILQTGSMTYKWVFDTTSLTLFQPSAIKFKKWGKHPITLYATSDLNCADTAKSYVYVYPNPVSAFVYMNNCMEDTMWFYDNSYSDSGSIQQWYWDFRNGKTSSIKNPFTIYSDTGNKSVTLVSTNNFGCSHDTTRFFRIETHVSTPELERATVEKDSYVLVEWKAPEEGIPMIFHLEKSIDSILWNPVSDFDYNTFHYNDHQTKVGQDGYYYRLNVTDSCNYTSPYSNLAKSILLTMDSSGQFPVLSWTTYDFWASGIDRYELQIAGFSKGDKPGSKNFQLLESFLQPVKLTDSITKLTDDKYCYRVVAYRNGDQLESVSNEVCIPAISHLFIPNAFTPNNDGLNDLFKPVGMYILEYNLQIYNKWGVKIFESSDINTCWDGKFKGSDCQVDHYFYQITVTGTDGKKLNKAGSLLLMR